MAAGLLLSALLNLPAQAADGPPPEMQADWDARLERAAALSAEGEARQKEARRKLVEKNAACPEKFLVNACLQANQEEYTQASRQARRLENEGRAIERQVRKEQLSEADLRHQAALSQRQAELAARRVDSAAIDGAIERKVATSRADKAKKAAEGEKRKAAEAEKLHRKQAAHNARVAAKVRQAQNAEGGAAGK